MTTIEPKVQQSVFDPLLTCLLQVARIEHRPCSVASATAGLPLVDEKLTPELFVRAAARVGLKSRVVARDLQQVGQLLCPAVLLLKDNEARVLVEVDAASGSFTLLDTETDGQQRYSLEQLQELYSGFCILVRPAFRFDRRTEMVRPRQQHGHWFWGVLAGSWRIYRDVLLASLLINLFALANPLFVMNVYDRVVPNDALETLWVLAIGVLIVYGFDWLLKVLRSFFLEVAGRKSDVLLSGFIFERVLGARLSEKPESVGAFASQLREFETVRNFITSSVISTFVDLPFTLLFLVVIAWLGGMVVIAPLVAGLLIVAIALYLQAPLRRAVEQSYQSSAQKNATLVETLANLETVKILGAEGRLQRNWERAVGHLALWGQRSRMISTSSSTVAGVVQQVCSVAVVVIGVYLIAERELTMGALIACVMLSSRALAPMGQVAGLLLSYHQAHTAYLGLQGVVDKAQERDEEAPFVQRPYLQGAIRFDNVSFAYPGEETVALKGVSFSIAPGERVGVIGRIGSGKSTLQKLMLGLYAPQEGSVLVDGVDIKQIDPADLRRNMGCVPQDVGLFYGSIKDNIVFGAPHVEDEEILRAATIAGVTEFANTHPAGFDRSVGERGQALSGGQRQSVAVARALLNDPPLYLFDEPSSGMDNASEVQLKENLVAVTEGKTLILVTHKTALLTLVDRLLVLDRGKLVADGPRDSVLEALKKGQLRVA